MIVKLLVEGGDMKPGPALGQKLGPVGINVNQVIQKVNEATKDFKGLKVPVELDINAETKEFDVNVFSPPVSELIKKELGLDKGSGLQNKIKKGNMSIEQIISIAKTKMPNMLARDLKSAVKSVIGTCVSLGVLVESMPASEVGRKIDEGMFEKEISEGATETPEEKRKELDEYFAQVEKSQQKFVQQQEASKDDKSSKGKKK